MHGEYREHDGAVVDEGRQNADHDIGYGRVHADIQHIGSQSQEPMKLSPPTLTMTPEEQQGVPLRNMLEYIEF